MEWNSFHYSGRVDIDKIFDEQLATLDPESPAYEEAIEVLELQRGITIDVELWGQQRGLLDTADASERASADDRFGPRGI